ncbi:hypothetical protein M9H77_30335 [Catharanthus roseus]|uniref:Uncharacterized protein n=2 Tax=Catharanthus roseus TaxID=4058 RepID=A0ACC0A0W0_CATRO|nr:hypothetical protein M9H77_30333 [Catharanthus roseus]KAI5653148.1 hypothetical protein M9H77_30335 [Catharanthus roseus]
MEEVSAHVHPGPLVPDVLTRNHENRCLCGIALCSARQIRGALMLLRTWAWSRILIFDPPLDWHVELDPRALLGAMWCASFVLSQLPTHVLLYRDQLDFMTSDHPIPAVCDTRLDLHPLQLKGNDHTYWATHHATHVKVMHQWRQHIMDGFLLPIEDLSSPRDDYIRWYWDITRVYIGNPAHRDTQTFGYQLAGADRRMMGCWRDHHHLRISILVS